MDQYEFPEWYKERQAQFDPVMAEVLLDGSVPTAKTEIKRAGYWIDERDVPIPAIMALYGLLVALPTHPETEEWFAKHMTSYRLSAIGHWFVAHFQEHFDGLVRDVRIQRAERNLEAMRQARGTGLDE